MTSEGSPPPAGPPGPLVQLHGVTKDYQGLRPLRVSHLELHPGQSIALLGFDAAMAEVLVNLITGASVPDTGEVITFGRATQDIGDADAWLAMLDQFGLLSERAVLVEQLTAEQSLAMPLTLELDDLPREVRAATHALADEVGLTAAELGSPVGQLPLAARQRVRLGRALALRPRVLLAEHPNAPLGSDDAPAFAADFARIVASRRMASLVITADRTFASATAEHVLTLEPATGALKKSGGWRRWFS